MMPTAELLVMETTRSAACPKQLSTKRNRRKRTVGETRIVPLRPERTTGTNEEEDLTTHSQ